MEITTPGCPSHLTFSALEGCSARHSTDLDAPWKSRRLAAHLISPFRLWRAAQLGIQRTSMLHGNHDAWLPISSHLFGFGGLLSSAFNGPRCAMEITTPGCPSHLTFSALEGCSARHSTDLDAPW